MTKNASHLRVPLTGSIIVADENTPDPTSFAGLDSLGTELGYTTEDGVTFSFSKETEDIMGWQSPDPLRRLVTSQPKTASFVLRQMERATWLATMGGTVTTVGDGLFKWEPDEGIIPVRRLFVYFKDGAYEYLIGFRRAQQMAEVEMNLVRNDSVNLANEWSALAAPDGEASWFLLTNDPAFADASGAVVTEQTGDPATSGGTTPAPTEPAPTEPATTEPTPTP